MKVQHRVWQLQEHGIDIRFESSNRDMGNSDLITIYDDGFECINLSGAASFDSSDKEMREILRKEIGSINVPSDEVSIRVRQHFLVDTSNSAVYSFYLPALDVYRLRHT